MPYNFAPCNHYEPGPYQNCTNNATTPQCYPTCSSGYPLNYTTDKHFGNSTYFLKAIVAEIQEEIMRHGPVQAVFDVYEDFLTYRSGVYRHVTGQFIAAHVGRIIGWGVQDNPPFWLVSNSWNTFWGDQGYFEILRGHDECGIERNVLAGMPEL